jgi:hypothetical protein
MSSSVDASQTARRGAVSVPGSGGDSARHGLLAHGGAARTVHWAVLWQVATPVWQAACDIPVISWNHMERISLAIDDLGCRELLA